MFAIQMITLLRTKFYGQTYENKMKSAFEEKKESSVGMTLQLFVQDLSTQIKVDFRNVSDEKRKHLKSQIKVKIRNASESSRGGLVVELWTDNSQQQHVLFSVYVFCSGRMIGPWFVA